MAYTAFGQNEERVNQPQAQYQVGTINQPQQQQQQKPMSMSQIFGNPMVANQMAKRFGNQQPYRPQYNPYQRRPQYNPYQQMSYGGYNPYQQNMSQMFQGGYNPYQRNMSQYNPYSWYR